MKFNITCKINLLTIIGIVFTSITLNIIFKHHYIIDEMEHAEEQVMAISRLETAHFKHHIEKSEFEIMHEHIKEYLLKIKNISDIRVYDIDGYLLANKDGIKKGKTSDEKLLYAIKTRSMIHRWDGYRFIHIEPIFKKSTPPHIHYHSETEQKTKNGDHVIGFLYIEYNADYLPKYLIKRRNYFIITTAIISLIFIAVSIILSRRLTKPLIQISDASKKVAEGDLSISLPVKSKDELGILALNFNSMIESLKSARAEIENYTKNLEHIINIRTERLNNAIKELQHEKDFIEKLFSTIGATIAVLDRDGKFVKINKTWEDLRGYKEDEIRGRYVWDIMPPDSVHIAKTMFEEMLVYKAPTTFKIKVLTKDGKERIIMTNNAVLTDENSEVTYIIASGIDITEKESLEKYLMESQKLQSIATLVTGLSHNFNNILVGVVGYAGILRAQISLIEHPKKTDIMRYIEIIENSANRASELIKHLMMFSKKQEYQMTELNINNIIDDTYQIISATFPKSISIQTDLQKDIWLIKADKTQIQQALLNMCINAKDAMPEGGILKIETFNMDVTSPEHAMQYPGRYVVIKISDTGHGMDEETKHRIFEPFFTSRSLLTHTGLGLSTAYNIIKNHNGYITVDSIKGKGSTFTIFLPVK
ncbi:hypothetical protein JZK55_16190 [Dissulfurispira thermophila]|uniref:histidine kinase n=1 Tax=Dissulfurispira thermophila TaxID=2715679 RepID=A0A7G1H4L8_9BACT|nr:PAS domain S-box protein [Dissulfurispira thermophila]BCB96697.1 hypothetical protein JZK55_16190 [Dissulfurispira thermophila]